MLARLRQDVPDRLLAALFLGLGFVAFLTVDQAYWWRLKPDYLFGWLVPILVGYVVVDRWPRLRVIVKSTEPVPPPAPVRNLLGFAFAGVLVVGLALFLFGGLYRAGFGSTQPGSLALAAGFGGILLGMVYFNTPAGRIGAVAPGSLWGALRSDARLAAVALFAFPALVWMISAPMVSAVENSVSLFLLRRVVAVVFGLFSFLGYPMIQEGNVLVLPQGRVGVVEACSGIRSLTGCLFAGVFLAAVCLDRAWKKVLLVAAALGFAFFGNLLRSLFLAGWAYAHGPAAIEGTIHDATGFAVLGLTVVGLFGILSLLDAARWRRWLAWLTEGGDAAKKSARGAKDGAA
jgi:exosortase